MGPADPGGESLHHDSLPGLSRPAGSCSLRGRLPTCDATIAAGSVSAASTAAGDSFHDDFGRDASSLGIDQDRDGGRGVRLASNPRRPDSAIRSRRFHGAEPGLNSILATQDAFSAAWTTKQPSGAPEAIQAANNRVEFDRRTPTLQDSVPGLLGGRRNATVAEQGEDAFLAERRCLAPKRRTGRGRISAAAG